MEAEKILRNLIYRLTLCDHLGDVCNDIGDALRDMGEEMDWDDLDDLGRLLKKKGWDR